MKYLIGYTLRLFVCWFLLFFVLRVFFVAYQWPVAHRVHDMADVWRALYKGWHLDAAISVALLVLPMLSVWAFYWFEKPIWHRLAKPLSVMMALLYNAVAIADAGLYREWQAKLNMQALSHFENPSEVVQTMSWGLMSLFFLFLSVSTGLFYWLYTRYIHRTDVRVTQTAPQHRWKQALTFFVVSGALALIIIRGGVTSLPMNQSIAYFSQDALANDIAVNPLYALLQDAETKSKLPDPDQYTFHTSSALPKLVAPYFPSPDTTMIQVLNTPRPNLLFIFLESWSSHNVGVLGGLPDATPQFDALSKEGLLFENTYATAYVTDQGISAVFSGTPSVSKLSVIQQVEHVSTLPCLSLSLKPLGYQSSFLFGGDLVFGNLKGYLVDKQFEQIYDRSNITASWPQGSLGLHDEYSLPWLHATIAQCKRPFLMGYLSQSTHRPYDFPARDGWQGPAKNPEPEYTRAVHYSDACIGDFIREAKKQSWYDSTLIILVADHSHNSWKAQETAFAERHQIPMLWLGGALDSSWRGKQWKPIVSQLDIAASLLHQMQLPVSDYPWSRNMFQRNAVSSSYFIYYGGGGYITPQGFASYYQLNKPHIFSNAKNDSIKKNLFQCFSAFQQMRYEQLLHGSKAN